MTRRIFAAFAAVAVLVPLSASVRGQNIYWNGTGTTWNSLSDWWTTPGGATPVASFSGGTIVANFNATPLITPQTITLDASQIVQGLVFTGTDLGGETINSGAGTNSFTIGVGGIQDNAGSGADAINSNVILGAAQTWTNNSANLLSINGNISESNAGTALTFAGVGTTVLGGSETYTGATTLSNNLGTLRLNFAAATAPLGLTNIINNGIAPVNNNITTGSALSLGGGTLNIVAPSTANNTVTQAFNGTTVTGGLSVLSFNAAVNSNTINLDLGSITRNVAGGSVVFTQTGTGTSNIYTTTANPTYTGGTNNILGGWALYASTAGSTSADTWATSAGAPGAAGLVTGFANYTQASSSTPFTPGADIDAISTNATALSDITINSLRFATAGALTVTGTATHTITVASGGILETSAVGNNAITITAGNLTSGNGTDLIINQYNTANTMTISASITGATGLTKNGPGALTLSAANATPNTFSGGTTVNGGTLTLSTGGSAGDIRGTLTINGGGIVNTTAANALGFGAGVNVSTLNINQGGLLNDTVNGDQGWAVAINLNGGVMQSNGGASNTGAAQLFSLGGGSSVNTLPNTIPSVIAGRLNIRDGNTGNQLAVTVADGPAPIDLLISAGVTQQNSTNGITKAGTGTMMLSGVGTFAGPTLINAGTLQLANTLAVQNSLVTLAANNDLAFAQSVGQFVIGGLNGSNLALVDVGGNPVTVLAGGNNSTSNFGGALNGAGGGLVKVGTGNLTLSAAGTYSGGTNVGVGTLVANAVGALGQGPVNVFPGATLNVAANANLPSGTLNVMNRATFASSAPAGIDQTFLNAVANSTNSFVVALAGGSVNNLDFSSSGANLPNASFGATGNFTYSGTLTPFGTNYNLGGGGGTLTINSILGGANTVTIGLNGTAVGGVILVGANTYSLGTNINAGTAFVGVSDNGSTSGALGTGSVNLGTASFGAPASLLVNSGVTFTRPITVTAGSLGLLTVGGSNTTGTATLSGNITLSNNLVIAEPGGGTLNLNGNITSGAAGTQILAFNNGGAVSVGGSIGGGTGTISVIQNGAGTTTLAVAGAIAGPNVTVLAGTLNESIDNALNGTGQTLTVNGGTVTFPNANSYTGITTLNGGTLNANISGALGSGDVVANGGTIASAATSGSPLGAGNITLTGGTIKFAPSGSGAVSLTAASNSGSVFNFGNATVAAGGGTLSIAKGTNTGVTLTVGNAGASTAIFNRLGDGTLVIADNTAALGDLGVNDKVLAASAAGAPSVINGMVNPSIVGQNTTSNSGDFLTYDNTNGFKLASYTATTLTGSSNTTITNITSALASQATASVYALRAGASIGMASGQTLTIGNTSLSSQAGLILDTSTISATSGTATLAFGTAEGLIYVNSGANTISTGITGSGGLTIFGPGTLTLSGAVANTYTGGTRIQGGVTVIEAANNLSSGPLSIDGGTLTNSSATSILPPTTQTLTVGPAGATINGSGGSGFTTPASATWLNGSGPITFTSTTTGTNQPQTTSELLVNTAQTAFTGNITISSGRIQVGTATSNPVGSGTITISGGGEFFVAASPLTMSNAFVLSGTNNGGNGGENRGQIRSDNGNLTLTGPITMTGNAGIVDDHGADTLTMSGLISGPFTLSFGSANGNGGAIYSPSNAGNSQAATTLGTGVLQISSDGNLGLSTGALTLSTAGASTLLAGAASVTLNANRPVILTGGQTTTFNTQANSLTINGPISETGVLASVVKTGAGTLVLGGANGTTGITTINAGTLQLAHSAALANSTLAFQGTGGALAFSPGVGTFNVGGLTGGTNIALVDTGNSPVTLQVGANSVSTTYTGALSGAGNLNKVGGGVLTMSSVTGSGSPSYSGTTTITSGTLAVNGSTSPLGTGPITLAGGRLQLQAGVGGSIGLQFAGNSAPAAALTSVQTAGVPGVAMSDWNTSTIAGGQATALPLIFGSGNGANSGLNSGATVTWTNPNNTFHTNSSGGTADTTLMSGYLDSNSAANRPAVTFTNIPYSNYSVYVYTGSDTAGRRQSATATVGSNSTTYFYQTDANISFLNPTAYVTTTNTINNNLFAPSANYLVFNGLTNVSPLTVTAGFLNGNGGISAIEIVNTAPSAAINMSNSLSITAGSTIDVTGYPSGTISGAATFGNSSGGVIQLNATGAGLGNGYTLNLGTVALTGNNTSYVFDVSGSGPATLNLGALSDGGTARTVVKQNSGTLTLTAGGSLVGGSQINVNGGTLRVTNSVGSATGNAPVTIASGATLAGPSTTGGLGSIAGAVTVNTGGAIVAGSTTGAATLTLSGGLSLASGASSTFTLSSTPNGTANPAAALVATSSGGTSLTVGGSHTINIANAPPLQLTSTYDLYSYTGTQLSGAQFNSFSLASSLPQSNIYSYSLANNPHQVDLIVNLIIQSWTGRDGGNGAVNSSWDTAGSTNWANTTPAAVTYADGRAVQFADKNAITNANVPNTSGLASVSIQSPAGVAPALVLFTNTGSVNGGVDYLLSGGQISGNTGLLLNGAGGVGGQVTLDSANSFRGAVTINAGQLNLGDGITSGIDNALGQSSGVTVASGTSLNLNSPTGASVTFGNGWNGTSATGVSVPLSLNGAGSGLSGILGALNSASGSNTYAGPITIGSGGATISSSSASFGDQLTLSGGATISSGATLSVVGSGNTTFTSAPINVSSGSGAVLFSPSGSPSLTISGGAAIAGGGTLTLGGTGAITFNTTAISGNGSVAYSGTGSGSLTLSADNSYSGTTTVNSNSVTLTTANALGNSSGVTVAGGANGALVLNNTSGNPMTFGNTAANAAVSVPLVLNGSGASSSGALASNSGNNTYSGSVSVGSSNAATVASNSASGNDGLTLAGGVSIPTGTTLTLSGAGNTTVGSAIYGTGTITGAGGLVVAPTGNGTVNLPTANSYGGGAVGTQLSSGTLAVANNSALGGGPLTISGGRLQLQPVPQQFVGLKFAGTTRGGSAGPFLVTGTAGAPGLAIGNWNNSTDSTATSNLGNLNYSTGTPSGINASWATTGSNFDTFNSDQSANQDKQLFNAFLNITGGARQSSITLTNIPFTVPYSIYAYVGAEVNDRNETVSVGATSYYFNTFVATAANNTGNFVGYIPITNTTSTSHPRGNYAGFGGLTGDTQTVTVTDTNNNGIYAVELVGYGSPSLSNAVTVNGSATIDVTGPQSAALAGAVQLGNTGGGPIQLSVTGGGTGNGSNYSLALGSSVTLTGNNTNYVLDVANNSNGSGSGALSLGALTDGGAAKTVTLQNAGTTILSAPGTLIAGSTINVGPAGGGNGGTLRVTNASGSATGNAAVIVNGGGTLRGSTAAGQGFIAGPATVANGGTVTAASGATLTLSGGLTLQDGSSSIFALGSPPNGTANPALALIAATALTPPASGTHTVTLTGLPPVAPSSTYDLFSYTSTQLTTGQFNTFQLNPTQPGNGEFTYSLVNGNKQIDLLVTLNSLTFTGRTNGTGAANGNWDVGTSNNWATPTPAATTYPDNIPVVFQDKNPLSPANNVGASTIVVQPAGVNPATVLFNNTGAAAGGVDYTFSGGPIGGATGLTLSGTGGVTLQSSNTLAGEVDINAGHLRLQDAFALGKASGVVVSSGGALELAAGSGNSLSYGIQNNTSNTIPLTLNGAGLASNPAGALNNVSGSNTFVGAITVGGGGATIGSSSNANGDQLTLSGGLSLASGATLSLIGAGNTTFSTAPITINGSGGTINFSPTGGALLTISGGVSLAGGSTLTLAGTGSTIVNGSAITDGGASSPGSLRVNGSASGTVQLAGGNSYYGTTTISSGTAILSSPTALGNSASAAVAAGGALVLNNTSGSPATFGATTANASVAIPLTIDGAGNGTAAGALASTAGNNTYAGAVTVGASNAATITSTSAGETLSLRAGVTIPTGATLTLTGGGNTTIGATGTGNLSGGGGLVVIGSGSGTVTLPTANTYGGGAVGTQLTSGTLAVGNNTALGTGPVTVSGGVLQLQLTPGTPIGAKLATGRVNTTEAAETLNGPAGAPGAVVSNWNNIVIPNGGVLSAPPAPAGGSGIPFSLADGSNTPTAVQVVAYSGANTYSTYGASQNAGTGIQQLLNSYIDNNAGTGGTANPAVVAMGNIPYAKYDVYVYFGSDGNGRTGAVNLFAGTTAATGSPLGTFYYKTNANQGAATAYQLTTDNSGATYPNATYAIFSGVTGNSFAVDTVNSGNNINHTGIFAVEVLPYVGATIGNSVTVNGNATIDVTGSNSAGISSAVSLGNAGPGPIQLSVTGGGAGAGNNYSLLLSGGITLTGGNSNYVLDVANNSNGGGSGTLVAGPLSDGGVSRVVTLQNSGSVNLSAASTLVGSSTFNVGPVGGGNGGTLRATNPSGSATGSAAVHVNSGGTLRGSTTAGQGFISGPVTVASGGTIAGGSGGTLSLSGGLTLQANSASSFNLGSPANGTADPTQALVAVTGGAGPTSLAVSGSNVINLTGAPPIQPSSTYDLFSYTGSQFTTGQFNNFSLGPNLPLSGAFGYSLVNGAHQIDLLVTLVPITWTGSNSGGGTNSSWDTTASSTNWANSAPAATSYIDGAAVIFANKNPITSTNVATSNVVVQAGGVSPASMTFTNTGASAGGVDYTFSGDAINGSTGLTLNGAGQVILQSGNNFTGFVNVNAGHLQLQNATALGNAAAVNVASGAALELASGSGNSVIYGNRADATAGISLTVDGAGLTAAPAGALNSISGINTYAGPVFVGSSGGATVASNSNSNGDALTLSGGVTLSSGATLRVTGIGNTSLTTNPIAVGSGGGTLNFSPSSPTAVLTAASGATLADNTNLTFAGTGRTNVTTSPITGNGSVTVSGTGSGTVAMSIGSSYASGTTVTGGTLALSNNSALGTGTLTLSGGRLQLQSVPAASIGIKFATGRGGEVPPNETFIGTAGAPSNGTGPSAVMSNWNNLLVGTSTLPFAVADANASATQASVAAFSSNFNYSTYGAPQIQGSIRQFLNSYIDTNAYVNVTNIPFSSYSVFVYMGSDANNRTGSVAMFPGTASTAGSPTATYYYTTSAFQAAPTYTQTTDNTGAAYPQATYAEFDNITTSSFSLQGASNGAASGNNGFYAVEIVPTVAGNAALFNPSIANAVVVNGTATIDVSGPASGTLSGAATIGNTGGGAIALNVTGTGTGAGTNYSLVMPAGIATTGNNTSYTLDVANNGAGTGTLRVGTINTSATPGATVVKSNAGTLEVTGALNLANNTAVRVATGKLRFTAASGAAVIGTGTSATVFSGATLELAGSVSALSSSASPASRVNVVNNSTQASGGSLLVSGTNQQVGAITGPGDTVVNTSSDLTANSIVQNALVIGGDATHPSVVTIDASDSSGNPLAAPALTVAGSLHQSPLPVAPFGGSSLVAGGTSTASLGSLPGGSLGTGLGSLGGTSAVPEPSTFVLMAVAAIGCLGLRFRRRRS